MARDQLISLWWTRVPGNGIKQSKEREILSVKELARADRFLIEAPRRSFITARAMLRQLLSNLTGISSSDIQFENGENGKPSLRGAQKPPVFFNLSHSGPFVVVAICHGSELGVDIEIVRPLKSAQRLAERFFSESEAVHLSTSKQHDRAFFHLWTSKEAYLKAIGTGLTVPLRSVEISPYDQGSPCILSINSSKHEAQQWSLFRPHIDDTAMCTIAIKGNGWTLSVEEFTSHSWYRGNPDE